MCISCLKTIKSSSISNKLNPKSLAISSSEWWICYIWFFRPSNVCLIGRVRGCRSEPSHPVARRRLGALWGASGLRHSQAVGSLSGRRWERTVSTTFPPYVHAPLPPNLYNTPTVTQYVKYSLSLQRNI